MFSSYNPYCMDDDASEKMRGVGALLEEIGQDADSIGHLMDLADPGFMDFDLKFEKRERDELGSAIRQLEAARDQKSERAQ